MTKELERCEVCVFWRVLTKGEIGACRRHAPSPKLFAKNLNGTYEMLPAWPTTEPEEWCGEFKKA